MLQKVVGCAIISEMVASARVGATPAASTVAISASASGGECDWRGTPGFSEGKPEQAGRSTLSSVSRSSL